MHATSAGPRAPFGVTIDYAWRGQFTNAELNDLHAEAFAHPVLEDDWLTQVERHSLGWVCARDGDDLVGFVNVVWDGGVHAFLVDTIVRLGHRRRGIGRRLVAIAEAEARAARCEWLHVDFDEPLRSFYVDECGFSSTPAGTIDLTRS